MKVLHFGCAYKPYRGGSRVRLEQLVTRMNQDEVELSLITHSLSDNLDDDLPFSAVLRTANANSVLPCLKVLRFIRARRPDAVILHNSRVLLSWLLFYRFFSPSAKIICELHSVRETSWLKRFINGIIYRRCNKLVVLSASAKDWVKRQYGVTDAVVIINGTDVRPVSGFADRPKYNPDSVHYVYAGSFHEWQGVVVLADAAHQLGVDFWRRNRLTLVGGGPAFIDVRKALGPELLSLDTVVLEGWSDGESVRRMQLDGDFLLAPRPSTLATETVIPLKVVDSVALKRPLVASRVGGLTELLGEGADDSALAIWVKPNDSSDLARAMRAPPSSVQYEQMLQNLVGLQEKMPSWLQSSLFYENVLNQVCGQS